MKKMLSILMIALLVLTSMGPLQVITAATVDFPGSVIGSEVNETNIGAVKVTMNEAGYTLTLHKHADNSQAQEQVGTAITGYVVNDGNSFNNVQPGLYYVKAFKAAVGDDPAIVKTSAQVEVKPKALTVGESTTNIISPSLEPYKLEATGVSGQSVRLYNNDNPTYIKQLPVTSAGKVTFDDLAASGKYQVTQVVNGAESVKSPYITVRPNIVSIEKKKDSGSSNNAGEILVKNAKQGNTLILYKNGNTEDVKIDNIPTSEYTFKNLTAGSYQVKHIENGVESKNTSNSIEIRNEQIPIIDLESAANYELRYDINNYNVVTPKKYLEPGYIVTDKNGTIYKGTKTNYFCGEPGVVEGSENTCTPLIIKIEVENNVITGDTGYALPGKYTVTYIATDGGDSNLTSTIVRNVTVYPNVVNLTGKNTNDISNDSSIVNRKTGEIQVFGVYAGATLKLYQESANGTTIEVPVRPENVNEGSYTFKGVPVGENYFVVQEVNGVQSSPSARIHIKDTTPPELSLNGSKEMILEVGDKYVEYGATAVDNIDTPEELSSKIQIIGDVNTNIPGIYTISYSVKDKAGNSSPILQRVIYVKPGPVIAIGSIATIGEVGVKNIFPGTVNRPTTLRLYKYNLGAEKFELVLGSNIQLSNNEVTQVFKKHGPGRYYVTQTVNGQESRQSNIVEIVDVDRPYITLNGPETIELVWDENKVPYYEKVHQIFTDPGAVAEDYLQSSSLDLTATMIDPNGNQVGNMISTKGQYISFNPNPNPGLSLPGSYKIIYTARAPRGSIADTKERVIIIAPPKVTNISAGNPGLGIISVNNGIFQHPSTKVTLYNTYGQMMSSQTVANDDSVSFQDVPFGLGYYVTQTINGIESAPSIPINVNLFADAKDSALITSFVFNSVHSTGIIDHESGKITVTVPKDTDITNLRATFTNIGLVKVGSDIQYSGLTIQDFSNQVVYTVLSHDGNTTKTYYVNVVKTNFTTNTWSSSVSKKITLSSTTSTVALSSSEKILAEEKGISFVSSDRAIHVPASNVIETTNASLTASVPTSVTKYTDPEWRKSVENVTEIKWGNNSNPFMQPLEIEMPNPENKAFAKLIREDGKLFAQIQPSEKSGTNIVGLASKSGIYALVENIAKPSILSTTNNGETSYILYSSVPDSLIYYTTSSANVTFDRSARNSSIKDEDSYSIDSTPSNLSNWTLYTPGSKISVVSGELYAFVMKDQMISPLKSIVTKVPIEWKNDIPSYSTSHILKITFNTTVVRKALYSGAIYVKDNATGKKVETKLSLSPDNKTILVTPLTGYTRGHQYTLTIEREFKGSTLNNEFLKQPLTRTFSVK